MWVLEHRLCIVLLVCAGALPMSSLFLQLVSLGLSLVCWSTAYSVIGVCWCTAKVLSLACVGTTTRYGRWCVLVHRLCSVVGVCWRIAKVLLLACADPQPRYIWSLVCAGAPPMSCRWCVLVHRLRLVVGVCWRTAYRYCPW